MSNNKINLLPNSKHFDDNDETLKHENTKTQKENFAMHIPDEQENNETIKQENKKAKVSFFSKLKNIFSKK